MTRGSSLPRAVVEVDGADLEVRIDPAPPDSETNEFGIRMLADVVVRAREDTVATVRVRGSDEFHYAAIVMRAMAGELVHLERDDGTFTARIAVPAGATLHLTVVSSEFETGIAWLEHRVGQGGMGMGGGREVQMVDDVVAIDSDGMLEAIPLPPPAAEAPAFDLDEAMAGEDAMAADDAGAAGAGRPAMPVPAGPPAPAPPAAPAEPAVANVLAEMPARVRREAEFVLFVRLSREKLLAAQGMAVGKAVVPVDAGRDIRIAVSLRGMEFAPGQEPAVDVRLPAPGAPRLDVPFRIIPADEGRGHVSVAVTQPPVATPLATIKLSASIVDPDDDGDGQLRADEPLTAEASLVAAPRELASLPTISIEEAYARRKSHLRITATVGDRTATHIVEIEKARFIDDVYSDVARIRRDLGNRRDAASVADARSALRDVGSRIAERLLGGDVGALLWRRRQRLSRLVVQSSGEVDIPWEIVHLVPPEGQPGDSHTHFLGDKGLTRWVYDTARPIEVPVRTARVVAVAPEYADPGLQLARTQEEVKALRTELGEDARTAATPAELSALLTEGVDLVHFAGHGRWREGEPSGQEIAFAQFIEAQDDGSASYRDVDARRDLPELDDPSKARSTPFVFLSACDVGRLRSGSTGLGGFAEVFLRGGVGVFIGCSWAVQDDAASAFVRAFYREAFRDGATLGDATLAARRAAHRAGDLNALAFTVFADPRARLVRQ